jgi:hypothetical protein
MRDHAATVDPAHHHETPPATRQPSPAPDEARWVRA